LNYPSACVAIDEYDCVMLSAAKHLDFAATCENEILRCCLRMTMTTQSLKGEEAERDSAFLLNMKWRMVVFDAVFD